MHTYTHINTCTPVHSQNHLQQQFSKLFHKLEAQAGMFPFTKAKAYTSLLAKETYKLSLWALKRASESITAGRIGCICIRIHMWTHARFGPREPSCRDLSATEPLMIGLFWGKWPMKIRHSMGFDLCICTVRWWPIECLIFVSHLPEKSQIIGSSFMERVFWVAKTCKMPYLSRLFVAKEPYN